MYSPRHLARNTQIAGTDFFGRNAHVLLHPNAQKKMFRWTVRRYDDNKTHLVEPSRLRLFKRRVALRSSSTTHLPVVEHILPLMWVMPGIHIIQTSAWPPYVMPGELLAETGEHSIAGLLTVDSEPFCWEPIQRAYEWMYRKQRGDRDAFTRVEPITEKTLIVDITIDYPCIGLYHKQYDLARMSYPEIVRLLSAPPPAIAPCAKMLRRILTTCRWKHVDRVVWPDVSSDLQRQKTLEAIADHRFLDILGVFGTLVDGYTLPAMKITSVCSGHQADVNVVTMMRPKTSQS